MQAKSSIVKANSNSNDSSSSLIISAKNKRQAEGSSLDDLFNFNDNFSLKPQTQTPMESLKEDLSKSVDLSISQLGDSNSYTEPGSNSNNNNQQVVEFDSPSSSYSIEKIQLTGANLAYSYRFEAFYLRFNLDSKSGSEHRINSNAFAAELQLIFYNHHLFQSFAEASQKPNGLAAISVLISELPAEPANTKPNSVLANILSDDKLDLIRYRGGSLLMKNLDLSGLLSDEQQFVSYEGSLTVPGCHESVTWLVLNKPLYVTGSNVSKAK